MCAAFCSLFLFLKRSSRIWARKKKMVAGKSNKFCEEEVFKQTLLFYFRNRPPHLHFQLSRVEPKTHDLPGVCSEEDVEQVPQRKEKKRSTSECWFSARLIFLIRASCSAPFTKTDGSRFKRAESSNKSSLRLSRQSQKEQRQSLPIKLVLFLFLLFLLLLAHEPWLFSRISKRCELEESRRNRT